jgi:NosR/NirI family nitrous oxide reductase transcriptional regulator
MMLEIIAETLQLTIAVSLVLAGILAILIWIRNQTRRVTILRFFIQIVSVIIIFLTLPLLAEWPSLVLGAIIVVTIVFGRFFCGWICPFGLYMDLITVVRTSLKIRYWKLSERLNNALNILRYAIVAGVLALPFFYDPLSTQVWRSFLLFQNQFKPLIVFFLGPLEPLLIPWSGAVGFNGYSLSYPYIREIIAYSNGPFFITLNVFLFIAFTVAGSFMVRRFWCRFCPTGASIAIVNRFKAFKWAPILKLTKVEEKCTKCGICKRVCPVQVTEVYEEKGGNVTSSKCVECFRCVEMCPYEGCLKVEFAGKTLYKSKNWLKEEE